MRTYQSLQPDVTYLKHLVGAVVDGIASARRRNAARPSPPRLAAAVWKPAALGAAVGILSASFTPRRKSGYRIVLAGLVGSGLGFGVGAAWRSRDFAAAAGRNTIQKVNTVRDAHWLEKNPIAYA